MDYPTHDTSLIGAAGVHHVVSELSLRGLIALPTIRNTSGVDVVVTNRKGTWHANLQVKSSRSKVNFWPIGKKYCEWIGPNNYYVFLRFNLKENGFETFLESSKKVARGAKKLIELDVRKGNKQWVPSFYPKRQLERLRKQWEQFGLKASQP